MFARLKETPVGIYVNPGLSLLHASLLGDLCGWGDRPSAARQLHLDTPMCLTPGNQALSRFALGRCTRTRGSSEILCGVRRRGPK